MTNIVQHQPVYEYWREFATLKIWEIASLMRGLEPRVLSDVVNAQNDGTDLSHEMRRLTSAVLAGELNGLPASTSNPGKETEITVTELVPWLKNIGLRDVAAGLLGDDQSQVEGKNLIWTPEYTEKVREYREIHGTKAAAEHFKISGARIREKLPGASADVKGYSVFKQGTS